MRSQNGKAEMAQPSDDADKPAAPGGRPPPLRNRRDCARYVAKLIRAAHRNEIPLDRAKGLGYMAQILSGLLADAELDDRLAAIEQRITALATGVQP
jgi:hypothetical protein